MFLQTNEERNVVGRRCYMADFEWIWEKNIRILRKYDFEVGFGFHTTLNQPLSQGKSHARDFMVFISKMGL